MTRRTWLVFCAVQLLGWILFSFAKYYGAGFSQSPLVAFSWLAAILLFLPGDLLVMALDETLNRVPNALVRPLVMVACNAVFWFACSAVWRIWRKLRDRHQL